MWQERKNKMAEIRHRIQKEYTRQLKGVGLSPLVENYFFFLVSKRINCLGIRSYFVNTIYNYIVEQASIENIAVGKHSKSLFDIQLPLIAESIISIQYYQNQILDGKGGVLVNEFINKTRLNQNLLSSHFVKDWLYDYINEQVCPSNPDKQYKIAKTVRQIFHYVDLGQMMQEQYGTYEALISPPPQHIFKNNDWYLKEDIAEVFKANLALHGIIDIDTTEKFVENYLRRIILCSSSIYILFADLIMDLLDYNGRERQNILSLAASIGIVGQLVNDNNDFVPSEFNLTTVAKVPDDALSDLRNNIITLPFIIFFQEKIFLSLNDMQTSIKRKPLNFFMLIISSLKRSMHIVQRLSSISDRYVNHENIYARFLLDMNSISIISENRFYLCINKMEEVLNGIKLRKSQKHAILNFDFRLSEWFKNIVFNINRFLFPNLGI